VSAGLTSQRYFAIWALRDAFEENMVAKEVANCEVSVASEWLIRCGTVLYNEALSAGQLDEHEAMITRSGSLYNGEAGYCLERWQFWKLRLSELKDPVDEPVTKMALQALNAMERAENGWGLDESLAKDSSPYAETTCQA
jgi:hypothetical protein